MRHGTAPQVSGRKRSRSRSAEKYALHDGAESEEGVVALPPAKERHHPPTHTATPTSPAHSSPQGSSHGSRSSSTASSSSSSSATKHSGDKGTRSEHKAPAAAAAAAEAAAASTTGAVAAAAAATTASSTSPTADMSPEDASIYALVTGILADWRSGVALLKEDIIRLILRRVRPILMSQPMLVRTEAPINVCGDIHGQITDLVEIFKAGGLPPNSRYLFLGDYVDRGKYGTEVITVLLGLKVLFPKRIYVLRGNHETDSICRIYGFFDEVKRRFNVRLFKEFTDVFNCLPVAALIEEIALCMHGGLSPELRHLRQIEQIYRPLIVPDEGLACDLLWSDPEEGSSGWQPSERGVSFTFGEDVATRVCDNLGIDIVLRAHQVVDEGYSFFAGRRLVTIFSASNYCGEFTNSGAMMLMDENCMCSFQIFKPEY
ncbi:serine/threonine-protein phosphatase PP1 [Novymonas esmeraldas]|uniref:Serine/threonine-protein phosphatase n=1 Tax=Novymonas esmeraldas TaxID=1808958 RepID=A0AAW0EWH5_9TRYP